MQCALIESSFKVFFQIINSLTAVFVQESDRGNSTHVHTLRCAGKVEALHLFTWGDVKCSKAAAGSTQNKPPVLQLRHLQAHIPVTLQSHRGSSQNLCKRTLGCIPIIPVLGKESPGFWRMFWMLKIPQASDLFSVASFKLSGAPIPSSSSLSRRPYLNYLSCTQ